MKIISYRKYNFFSQSSVQLWGGLTVFPDYDIRSAPTNFEGLEFITDEEILQTLSAELSWSHNTHLLVKAKTIKEYQWYAKQTIENGWSLSSLEYHSGTKAYQRQAIVEKATNYDRLVFSKGEGVKPSSLNEFC